ncbi:MAG: MarR family transcriptional regulator, partial [Alphaproteobacteria bacterium]
AKFTALLLIRDNPGCDQTALGRALSVNRSSAMKLVNILEERGWSNGGPGGIFAPMRCSSCPKGKCRSAR